MINLSAIESAARAATPGPARNSICGLPECKGKRECDGCVARRIYAPALAFAVAADPATVLALVRIARAAVEWDNAATDGKYSWDDFAAVEQKLIDALRDAGLL